MSGWIKLHKSFTSHWLYENKPYSDREAWIDLLLHANYKPGSKSIKGQLVPYERGQQLRSQVTLSRDWGWSRDRTRRFLKKLVRKEMLIQQNTNLTSIITICNYDEYQGGDTADNTASKTADNTADKTADDTQLRSKEVKKGKKERIKKTLTPAELEGQGKRREIWQSYKDAFFARYSVDPVRNAKVNTLIKQLHERLGEEAKFVAAFYVTINDQFLIKQSHALGPLLQNCEGYVTQWRRGQAVTTTSARQTDQSQSNYDAAEEAIAIRRAQNANGK